MRASKVTFSLLASHMEELDYDWKILLMSMNLVNFYKSAFGTQTHTHINNICPIQSMNIQMTIMIRDSVIWLLLESKHISFHFHWSFSHRSWFLIYSQNIDFVIYVGFAFIFSIFHVYRLLLLGFSLIFL